MIPLLLAVASGHSGVARVRSGPEASDVALFVLAALAIWVVRRALRARFRDRADPGHRRGDGRRDRRDHGRGHRRGHRRDWGRD
ncbi:hypothetical protein [Sphingomonas bacterium]|uniref:hypothetical protein n=1 Tax=Sphingomonas bacterium TaxID=1895847 RepID=UPI001576C875|nr:hypothetical protein [Sphingomonas bacterium]